MLEQTATNDQPTNDQPTTGDEPIIIRIPLDEV